MTHKVTVRFGGAADSEVHDYSDRIRLLDQSGTPLTKGGMQADNGSPGMGELILDDVDNDIPHRTEPPGLQIAAHNQLIWSEDSPGYDAWLSIGRVDNKNVGRPYTYTAGVNRQWTVQWADANIDLDGLTLTADEVRPAETAANRVLYFLGAFCNGDPRLTTVFQTHLVNTTDSELMPVKTYEAGTELVEVFEDCASVDGRIYAVVIHEDEDEAGDHTCFLYIDEEDHDTYPCTISISDQLADVDGEAVFEPYWRQGGATLEQGQELVSGIVSRYGMDTTATAVVLSDVTADAYDYWVKPYNDDLAATATEATARAGAIVRSRNKEHVSHQPSILIPARLHNLIRAGMSIDIRSAAAMGGQYLGTTQTRRIAAIEWSHAGWTDEPYLWANLQLDRTPRKLPLSQGTKPGPKPPSGGCTLLDKATYYPKMDGEELWNGPWADGGDGLGNEGPGDPSDADGPHSGSYFLRLANSLANPWSYYVFGGTWTAGGNYTLGFWTRVNASAAPAVFTFGYDSGTGFPVFEDSVTLTVPSEETVWTYHELEWVAPSTISSGGAYNTAGVKLLVESPDNSDGVDFDDATVQECTDAEPPPASDDGTGDPGSPDTGCYSPCDHKHPAQTAAVTPITDSGGYYTGTNVEAALQELGAAGATPYTDEQAQDAVGGMVADTTTVNLTYTDATPELKADVIPAGIKLDDLGAPDDNTDLNASTSKHGLLPKLGGGTTNFLRADGTWAAPAGGGGSLTVEEVDGTPTDSAVTKLIFPNGTLSITSHEATYTPSGGGGGPTIQYPALKPATPTYDFAGASLSGAFSAHSSQGSFGLSNVITQGADWSGSSVELEFSQQMGQIYVAHANTDLDFTVGGVSKHGLSGAAMMIGIAALDSAGSGVGITSYFSDNNSYLATITTWNYASFSDSFAGGGGLQQTDASGLWFRLKRVSGTWTGYFSRSGRAWDKVFSTRSDSVTVDKLVFGIMYNSATAYTGRLTADYFHVDA